MQLSLELWYAKRYLLLQTMTIFSQSSKSNGTMLIVHWLCLYPDSLLIDYTFKLSSCNMRIAEFSPYTLCLRLANYIMGRPSKHCISDGKKQIVCCETKNNDINVWNICMDLFMSGRKQIRSISKMYSQSWSVKRVLLLHTYSTKSLIAGINFVFYHLIHYGIFLNC